MRYFYQKPKFYMELYGETYICDHPLYNRCTLYILSNRGLAIVQQRYDAKAKCAYWDSVDPWIANDLYLSVGFKQYFDLHAKEAKDGLYPTVELRKIMYALHLKPLEKNLWEKGI